MKITTFLTPWLLALCLAIGACSQQESTTSAKPEQKRSVSVEIVAAQAKGFSVGAVASRPAAHLA